MSVPGTFGPWVSYHKSSRSESRPDISNRVRPVRTWGGWREGGFDLFGDGKGVFVRLGTRVWTVFPLYFTNYKGRGSERLEVTPREVLGRGGGVGLVHPVPRTTSDTSKTQKRQTIKGSPPQSHPTPTQDPSPGFDPSVSSDEVVEGETERGRRGWRSVTDTPVVTASADVGEDKIVGQVHVVARNVGARDLDATPVTDASDVTTLCAVDVVGPTRGPRAPHPYSSSGDVVCGSDR